MAKVLVVDDSRLMRHNLITLLKGEGHEIVDEAVNGQQAVVMYIKHKPDLVTMDITMPEMNGIDATRNILHKFPDANILMVSSIGEQKMVIDAIRSGANGYLLKPFQREKFQTTLQQVLYKEEYHYQDYTSSNSFDCDQEDGVFHVTIRPGFCYDDMSDFNKSLLTMINTGAETAVFDLNGIIDCDDRARGAIAMAIKRLQNTGCRLQVTGGGTFWAEYFYED